MKKYSFLIILSFTVSFFAQAQNPFLALLGSATASEERLLYKKPAGPFEITIDGERLLERAYFKMDIRQDNQPIAADADVILTITPPASAGSQERSYTALHQQGLFVVDPIELTASQDWGDDNWLASISVKTSEAEGSTSFGTLVYAPKPSQDIRFGIFNIALPLVVLVIFVFTYKLRGVRLEQTIQA